MQYPSQVEYETDTKSALKRIVLRIYFVPSFLGCKPTS